MVEVLVRRAKSSDVEAMCDLLGELFSIEQDFSVDRDVQFRGLSLMLGDVGRSVLLVGEKDGLVVGMLTMQILISTARGSRVGLIEDMIIKDGYRGNGIGGELLRGMEKIAEEEGLGRIQLLADVDNVGAQDFYKKNEWDETKLICMQKLKEK